jgi:hypothetical protein
LLVIRLIIIFALPSRKKHKKPQSFLSFIVDFVLTNVLWKVNCLVVLRFVSFHDHLVPSLLLVFLLCSWLLSTIVAVNVVVSFMVMVAWCNHCYYCSCFFHGHSCLAPSLLLLFVIPSWLWLLNVIVVVIASFVIVVT